MADSVIVADDLDQFHQRGANVILAAGDGDGHSLSRRDPIDERSTLRLLLSAFLPSFRNRVFFSMNASHASSGIFSKSSADSTLNPDAANILSSVRKSVNRRMKSVGKRSSNRT